MAHPQLLKLSHKVALLGIGSVLVTAAALVSLVVWQSGQYNRLAQDEVDSLIEADLDHITQSIYNLVRTENEAVQKQVDDNLNVARYILLSTGGVSLSEESVAWTAINQFTDKTSTVQLRKMLVGGRILNRNTDPATETSVVDQVTRLVGETATIFQRMNESGDMLRVATTVRNAEGQRAIGTYIPAVNPDGSPDPVIKAVLNGQTYHGRAFVVNDWYLTAYEPIYDKKGVLVGMLYVGIKQKAIEERVRQAILQTKVGKTGYVFVLGGHGAMRGRYIVSKDGQRDGEDIWESKDAEGGFFIQTMVNRAITLQPGALTTQRYAWQNPGEPALRWKVARLAYYAPWDWVIGTSVYEDELLAFRTVLSDGRHRMTSIMGLAGFAITIVIGLLGVFVAWTISRPVRDMTEAVKTIVNGNLNQTVQSTTQDEVGALAQAFNVMTHRLKQTMEELSQSEGKYRVIYENAIEGLFQIAHAGHFLNVNPTMARILGYHSPDNLVFSITNIRNELFVNPKDYDTFISAVTEHGLIFEREAQLYRKNKEIIWVSVSARKVSGQKDGPLFVEGFLTDISERKKAGEERARLKEQLLQAQKMESVGILAGGIAHDFNNLLTPILGYSDLLIMDFPPEDPRHLCIKDIKRAAERAKELTQQLLAFSRKQMLEIKPVALGDVVQRYESMLHHTLREDIQIETQVAPDLGLVRADIGQIEQVLVNLAINAQDAMPNGGRLTIRAENAVLDEAYARQHPDSKPGPYIRLSVSDTGIGMAPETKAHLFEPFFTTKERGKGTGLGLSTAYGIVKQHEGSISILSEPDKGTTIQIYLPRYGEPAQAVQSNPSPSPSDVVVGGSETILVVEDNSMVREMTCQMLRRLGYRVISADSAETCFPLAEDFPDRIDLLLTDVVLPKKDGKEVFTMLSARRKNLKVVYMSGYASNTIVHHGVLEEGIRFLHKPLSYALLARTLREALDS